MNRGTWWKGKPTGAPRDGCTCPPCSACASASVVCCFFVLRHSSARRLPLRRQSALARLYPVIVLVCCSSTKADTSTVAGECTHAGSRADIEENADAAALQQHERSESERGRERERLCIRKRQAMATRACTAPLTVWCSCSECNEEEEQLSVASSFYVQNTKSGIRRA